MKSSEERESPGIDGVVDAGADLTVSTVPGTGEMSPLETRYRWLLRILPAGYRTLREQEMVDAFVRASIDEDPELADLTLRSGWPGWSESLSVVRLALRLRWADPHAPRRYRTVTAGLRVATLGSLVVLAVIGAQTVFNQVWLLVAPPPGAQDASSTQILFGADPRLWSLARDWAFALWIPCLILAVWGGRTGARWAATIAVIPAMTTVIATAAGPFDVVFTVGGVALVVIQAWVILGLAGMASSRTDTLVRHRWCWLLAAAFGFLALMVPTMLALLVPERGVSALGYIIVDIAGVWCGASVVAAAVLVVRRLRGTQPGTAVLLGVAGLAGAATVLRACMLPVWVQLAHTAGTTPILISICIQLALVSVIALTAGVLGTRQVHALPPAIYQPADPAVVPR